MVEKLAAILATHLNFEGEVAQQFNDLCHMIIILGEEFSLTLRVKQVLCSQQLKDLRMKKINQNMFQDEKTALLTTQATLQISTFASQSRRPSIASGERY